MLVHLAQNGANVEVDVRRIEHLQAVINRLVGEVQVIVLNFKRLLEVGEGGAELLSAAEDASEIVISDGAVLVSILRKALGFSEQFECDLEILCQWSGVFNLPFWRKLIDRMLQMMAASCELFITGSERSPYNSFCIEISSSNFLSASR